MAAPSALILCLLGGVSTAIYFFYEGWQWWGLSREYPKKLFGPMFYSWWNSPLTCLY